MTVEKVPTATLRIAPADAAKCSDCGDVIDVTRPGVGEWCTGFTVNRKGGGANALSCRTGSGLYLCPLCVHRRQNGLPLDQPSLFPEWEKEQRKR